MVRGLCLAISLLAVSAATAAAADGDQGCGGDVCSLRRELDAEQVRVWLLSEQLDEKDVVRALSRQQQFVDSFGFEVPAHRQEEVVR